MQVKMLTAMAGDAFSYRRGDIVSVKKVIGEAWILANIAEEIAGTAAQAAALKSLDKVSAELVASEEAREVLEEKITKLIAENSRLQSQLSENGEDFAVTGDLLSSSPESE